MLLLIAVCLISGFLVSVSATACLRTWAPRWGLVDRPNAARKIHSVPIPLGGGIGIWLGLVVPLAAAQGVATWIGQLSEPPAWFPAELARHLDGVQYRSAQLWELVVGGTVLAALGLIDDLRNLSWWPKLIVQTLVASGLVAGGIRATLFVSAPWLGAVVSVLWIVVLTNAFNFLDNMDGLSAGIALIAASLFATIMLVGTSVPHWFVAGFLLILVGALAGFLVHNRPPARIFMGDTGSCLIGMMLAAITISGTFYEYEGVGRHVMLAPLCILAVPLYDFGSVLVIRLAQGRSPFHADKSHFSHRLVELGLSRTSAVMTIHLLTLTTGLGGLLLYQVPGWGGAIVVMCVIVCMLAVIAILEAAAARQASRKALETDH